MSQKNIPKVCVVVINWNQTDLTLACLRSLAHLNYPNLQVVLVDNGSHTPAFAQFEAAFPGLTLIRHERNLGFTGGCNAGLGFALRDDAQYAMLLNNDTEVAPDMLTPLVEFAESSPSIGIVGPLIHYYDQPNVIWSAGGRIDAHTGQSTSLLEGSVDSGNLTAYQVDYISGCALLIKCSVVRQIGLLDERFFAYYEEADWCARACEAHYKIWINPKARVWHKISMAARSGSPWYIYLMTRNRLLYLHNRKAPILRILSVILGQDLPLIVGGLILSRHRGQRYLAVYRARGTCDFLLKRFGKPSL